MTREYVATTSQTWYGHRTDYTLNGKPVGYKTSNGDSSFKNWNIFNDIEELNGGVLRCCPKCQISFYVGETLDRWNSHTC